MSKGRPSPRPRSALIRRASAPALALPLALLLLGGSAPAASATSSHGPKYSLRIVEGETNFPEYEPIAFTGASVQPSGQVAVTIIRNGTRVYRDEDEHGSAGLGQAPEVGDTVTLEAPVGTLIASVVYDGLPSADATVCAGSTNFSGANSPGDIVEGTYVAKTPKFDPYGHFAELQRTAFGEAQVKTLSGVAFGGSFLVPLALGETVTAIESLKTPLAGEATYTYTSENERPVGACPLPPPVFSPPPPPILQGSIAKFLKASIRSFLRLGALDQVTINQPGTVTQELFLKGGVLPAFAALANSKSKAHSKPPAALLLAKGVSTAKAAGKVDVLLHLTARGRHRLKSSKSVKAVLITTLRSSSGASINLARRTITLHR